MSNDFVKVPFYVEEDGTKTFFLPDCRTPSGFRVGPKGQEQTFVDYWQALSHVMSVPRHIFRRANKSGNFGGVVCKADDVEEVSRSHIEQMIAKPR